MKSLYPSTLFHFTKNYDFLIQILRCKYFKVSHSTEDIYGKNEKHRKFAIPMVSFCDIRLSHLTEHTISYGGFGIGLKKSWGIDKGLNPVFYINKNCSMIDYFNAALRNLRAEKNATPSSRRNFSALKSRYRDLVNPFRYMKNYEGDLVRVGHPIQKDYRFANESEWRYVPDIRARIVPIRTSKNKKIGDEKLLKYDEAKLFFTFDDIRYIFIENDDCLQRFISDINIYWLKEDANLILSKLIVTSNIFDDV